jgi:hypothetical protein
MADQGLWEAAFSLSGGWRRKILKILCPKLGMSLARTPMPWTDGNLK